MSIKTSGMKLLTDKQQTTTNPDGSITVFVPISFKRTGGRKMIMTPTQQALKYADPKERDSLVVGVLRAYRWLDLLETRTAKTAREIAIKENISHTYISKLLKVTILAPDIIEAILDGRQPPNLTLADCCKPMPHDWDGQRRQLGFIAA